MWAFYNAYVPTYTRKYIHAFVPTDLDIYAYIRRNKEKNNWKHHSFNIKIRIFFLAEEKQKETFASSHPAAILVWLGHILMIEDSDDKGWRQRSKVGGVVLHQDVLLQRLFIDCVCFIEGMTLSNRKARKVEEEESTDGNEAADHVIVFPY